MPAWTYARANGHSPVATWPSHAPISWCGKIRSEPPPETSNPGPRWRSAIAVHSTCQPGRPRPKGDSQDGSPGRSPRQSSQSSGLRLPARPGSPPRSAKSRRMVSSSYPEIAPNLGAAATEKYTSSPIR